MDEPSLQGKVALITGTSTGLGRAAAEVFARRGASVLAVARRAELGRELEDEVRAAGGSCRFVRADISRVDECARVVREAVDAFGRLDVLINNAGVVSDPPIIPSHELDEAQWDRVLGTNLKGAFFCCRHALPEMIRGGGGQILNIASINAIEGPTRMVAYSSAKAGLVQMSRTLAVEYLEHGVRVNAIILGGVHSEQQALSTAAFARWVLGREPDDQPPPDYMQDPADVARALALLCHDDARLITGATIAIDRAMTAGGLASSLIYMTSAGLWSLPGSAS